MRDFVYSIFRDSIDGSWSSRRYLTSIDNIIINYKTPEGVSQAKDLITSKILSE